MEGIQWQSNLRNLVVCLAICSMCLIRASNTFAEPNMGLTGFGRIANLKRGKLPHQYIKNKEIQ